MVFNSFIFIFANIQKQENILRHMKKVSLLNILLLSGTFLISCHTPQSPLLSAKELLGKKIFFDESLSLPEGQSCATCHTPEKGYADKFSRSISEGAVQGLFSNRNSMTICYSAFVPPLHYDEKEETYIGGLFWDGRSHSLQDQAGQPFINPVEMGNTDYYMVVEKVKNAPYFHELLELYGKTDNRDTLYGYITDALSAYQRSQEVNRFSSKYDAYLEGKYQLSETEKKGLELFEGKGMCAECHILDPDPAAKKVLFTDHTYDNLGIPKNPENPYYCLLEEYNPEGLNYIDPGLGAIVNDSTEYGKFRVPTLRNIALTAPYGHNGYFGTLEEIVHFYNVRDISNEFPEAEYPATVNTEELGDLKLTPEEESYIVAFLKILTDETKK